MINSFKNPAIMRILRTTERYEAGWREQNFIPDDEAYRLILCRSYDIKLQKNRRFWGEMYQIYPICLKMSTSDFARILPKSRMRFFVAAWIFTTGGTVLRAYRQSWQTKPQQFPKENSGEGDLFSPAVYYRCPRWNRWLLRVHPNKPLWKRMQPAYHQPRHRADVQRL